ncbi:hypothetical protein SSX86_020931 [Deinandra increscens subsp. villosa]|uniref:Coilin n=1 Tax=Deinandra increscens subsp. villosa TaxID=3103831 RepID=A0AAP0CTX8_9ASTR
MEIQSLRIRLIFDDCSVLSVAQRFDGMSNSWILIEPNQLPKISDACDHLLHKFNLTTSCPNGILLFMEGFVLPPSESTRILKDNDIICVKRKGMALAEAVEGTTAANEEFDKENGGYQSESKGAEVENSEEEPSPKETTSKKRKASPKPQSSKKKKHRSVVMDGVEDEVATENNGIKNDECLPMKIINKKIKSNKEKRSGESETIIENFKSPSKVKRKKKHHLGVVIGDEVKIVTGEIDNVNNYECVPKKKSSKKKNKPNEEIEMAIVETSDGSIKDDVEGVEQPSTTPDGTEKVASRSSRRKKAKRKWRRELAKSSQNVSCKFKLELKQDQVLVKAMHKNIVEQEERNHNDNGVTKLVPCVVKPGHIRFEPLDEGTYRLIFIGSAKLTLFLFLADDDARQIEVPDVTFQWNGITSKKKGQKWGLEKFSTFKADDSQKATKESSTMSSVDEQIDLIAFDQLEPSRKLSVDAEAPLIDLIAFDQLPLCSSPKEGDVIVYRVLELSSSWTPELSSFRVGKVSFYDADNIVLMPVPEYPIVLDKTDENGPDNSLYKDDGSLEIKFAALADVRSLKQSNLDAVKTVSNGVNQTAQVDEKSTALNLMSSSNGNVENISKYPCPGNKKGNTWDELEELLTAKKSVLLETNEETKKDPAWNKWSYRALRGSALGPTISLLRSKNDI